MSDRYTAAEMMTVTASRALSNGSTCFVGIGLPSEAANLARLTHAPDVTLIYESGTLQTKPDVLPLSIGDGELCESALTTVSVPEMFRYWLQGGHISVGFLGTAQIDRFANLNTTLIGDYREPKVRLPGGGGEILVDRVRKLITRGKCLTDEWLDVHRAWHNLGGRSSATMMSHPSIISKPPPQAIPFTAQMTGL